MPSSIVKTKEDERLWDKAKDIAAEAGKKEEYDYIMGIYKKMNPDRFAALSPGFLLALRHAHGKTASMMRYDERFLASNGKWYLILGNNEHDEYEDSTAYGPFPSEAAVDKYAQRFSNSGGGDVDDSGRQAPPTKSPNGGKLVSPTAGGYGGGGYGGYGGSRWADDSAKRIAEEFLKTSAEPPLHLAAEADEAVGQAYRDLVSLKLGFDTWEEIPETVQPLYRWIGKAIASLVEARQMTTNVREIVKHKRY